MGRPKKRKEARKDENKVHTLLDSLSTFMSYYTNGGVNTYV